MFRLSKWYLDCVTDAGDAVVLYWASLRWGVLRLRYGAALVKGRDDGPTDHYTLRPGPEPRLVNDGDLHWSCKRLHVSGDWTSSASSLERTLLAAPRGRIQWHCLTPRANATVNVGGRTLRGLGYVEHLTMTHKPWLLPLDELRWGRFLSPADVVVWIDWRGSLAHTWVWVNGVERPSAVLTSNRVELPDDGVVVAFDDGAVLRSGPLAATALRPLRAAALVLPRWGAAHETKWLARGTVTGATADSAGWVIHEVVRWQ